MVHGNELRFIRVLEVDMGTDLPDHNPTVRFQLRDNVLA
jgi:hypothetical protein